jgi:E3 ubiquitin-protein ligase TRIP12
MGRIDKDLGKVTNDLFSLNCLKKHITEVEKTDYKNKLLYNNTKLEELEIPFVVPGYSNLEMKENGENIMLNEDNIEEYLNLLLQSLCFYGIKDSINAFRKGFNLVFPVTNLNCFLSEELSEILCGSFVELWDFNTLKDSIIPNYGYDRNR